MQRRWRGVRRYSIPLAVALILPLALAAQGQEEPQGAGDGRTPAFVVAHGSDPRVLAFSGDGALIGRGFGAGTVRELTECPGDTAVVELVDKAIALRDLVTLDVIAEYRGPADVEPGYDDLVAVTCLGSAGPLVALAAGWMFEPGVDGVVWVVDKNGVSTVAFPEGRWLAGDSSGRLFALSGTDGREYGRLDAQSGEFAALGSLPDGWTGWRVAVSPGGETLAVLALDERPIDWFNERSSHVLLFDATTGVIVGQVALGASETVLGFKALIDGTFAVSAATPTGGVIRVFDAAGVEHGPRTTERWISEFAFVGDTLVTWDGSGVALIAGDGSRIRTIEVVGPDVHLVAVPQAGPIDPRAIARVTPGPLVESTTTTAAVSTTAEATTAAPATLESTTVTSVGDPGRVGLGPDEVDVGPSSAILAALWGGLIIGMVLLALLAARRRKT